MDNKEFAQLRARCFKLVEKEIQVDPKNNSLLKNLSNICFTHLFLPPTELVINTYKGIIGYKVWLDKNNVEPKHLISTAFHDLHECIKYDRDDGYSPRSSQYVKFYKEEP